MPLRLIQAAFFLLMAVSSSSLTPEGHLKCFQFGAVTNKAVAQLLFWTNRLIISFFMLVIMQLVALSPLRAVFSVTGTWAPASVWTRVPIP